MNKEDTRRLCEGAQEERLVLRPGQLAEKLRQQTFYKAATSLYVAPTVLLGQIRINALLDGKVLVCPALGLKRGFFLLRPYAAPFARLSYAVTPKGMEEYGEILTSENQAAEVHIDLAVVEALAADHSGCMVGDGNGFFDLSMAILAAWNMLAAGNLTIAVLPEKAIVEDPISVAPWDCFANFLLTERRVLALDGAEKGDSLPLFWDQLPERRIRKITPLWKLRQVLQK